MINNQEWFNKEYSEEEKEIELEDVEFEGQLIIKDYLELKDLYLRDIESIDKIVLENLPQLQKCTIWNCGMQDLVIENCLQVKELNIRNNFLTNLKFLTSMDNLEKLELDYNSKIDSDPELIPASLKFLSCEGTKLKPFQKLLESAKQNPQELAKKFWDLNEENKKLRKKNEEYSSSPQLFLNDLINFEKKYQKLKETISSLFQEEQKKSDEIKPLEKIVTTNLATDELIEKLKKQKEDLSDLEKANQELKGKFTPFEQVYQKIEKKEKELKELKNVIITKNHLEEDDLEDILEAQTNNDFKRLERTKNKLARTINEVEINDLLHLQSQIIQLQKNFNQREEQINQVINNYSIAGNAVINSTVGDNADLKTITYQSTGSSSNQAIAGSSSQKAQIEQKPNKWLSWRDKP